MFNIINKIINAILSLFFLKSIFKEIYLDKHYT